MLFLNRPDFKSPELNQSSTFTRNLRDGAKWQWTLPHVPNRWCVFLRSFWLIISLRDIKIFPKTFGTHSLFVCYLLSNSIIMKGANLWRCVCLSKLWGIDVQTYVSGVNINCRVRLLIEDRYNTAHDKKRPGWIYRSYRSEAQNPKTNVWILIYHYAEQTPSKWHKNTKAAGVLMFVHAK